MEPSRADSTPSEPAGDFETTRVIVVGGGIAGLATARWLHAAGVDARVLEARARIGGRLLSVAGGLDLGATWFWAGEQRVSRLVHELGLATFAQYLDGDALFHSAAGGERMRGNPLDVPAARFAAGAASLAAAVAGQLPRTWVRTAHPVERIRLSVDGVTAHTPARVFHAESIVLAVPPALAVAGIDFDPGLASPLARIAASTPVWMGAMTKVLVTWETPFWRDAGLAGSAFSHVGPLREIHDACGVNGAPAALFGFAPAPGPGQGPVGEAAVRAQLRALFGADAPAPTAVHIQAWGEERWTSPPGVARLQDYGRFGDAAFQEPYWSGRLHWASTETATEAPGHIEGALCAAQRTAQRITGAAV